MRTLWKAIAALQSKIAHGETRSNRFGSETRTSGESSQDINIGQAKRRGTYEQRLENAELARQIIHKAFPHDSKLADGIVNSQFGGDKLKFAQEIMSRQGQSFYRGWRIVKKLMDPHLYAADRGNQFSPCFKTREELCKWIDEQEDKNES